MPPRHYYNRRRRVPTRNPRLEMVAVVLVIVVVLVALALFLFVFHDIPLRGSTPY